MTPEPERNQINVHRDLDDDDHRILVCTCGWALRLPIDEVDTSRQAHMASHAAVVIDEPLGDPDITLQYEVWTQGPNEAWADAIEALAQHILELLAAGSWVVAARSLVEFHQPEDDEGEGS